MFILGIMGKKQHGKDSVAKILIEKAGFIMIDDFAMPIRKALCAAFGWNLEDFDTEEHKEAIDEIFKISKRQGMQSFGDDYAKDLLCSLFPAFKEAIGENLWVVRYLQSIDKIYHEYQAAGKQLKIVVPGVRFKGEIDVIREKFNCPIWKVYNPRKVDDDSHKSEKNVDRFPYDQMIINDGTKEDLERTVLYLISQIDTESDRGVILPDNLVDLVVKR